VVPIFIKKVSFVALVSVSFFIQGMDDQASLREILQRVAALSVNQDQLKVEMGAEAAKRGDLDSLKHFIDSSNVNKLTHNKLRVFHNAIVFAMETKDEKQYGPLFDYLFSIGGGFQKKVPGEEQSPLIFASTIGCHKEYARPIEILLEKGADPFESQPGQTSAAVIVAVGSKHEDCKRGALPVLQLFRSRANDLDQAIQCLDVEKVKQFANADTIKKLQNEHKCPVAHILPYCFRGYKDSFTLIDILLSSGVNPNEQLKGEMPGITCLVASTMHALKKGKTDLIEICLKHGGNPKHKLFPMAPSAVEMVKAMRLLEANNPHVPKVTALLNTNA
jgi:hypothetical protein